MRQINLIKRNSENFEKAVEKAREKVIEGTRPALAAFEAGDVLDNAAEVVAGARGTENLRTFEDFRVHGAVEAIILEEMRPAWFIKQDKIEIGGEYDRTDLVTAEKPTFEKISANVGRIDLIHHPRLGFGGTGWLIAEDVAVTNRHVASIFAKMDWLGRWSFAEGAFDSKMEARLNYLRQHETDDAAGRRAEVTEILYIAGPNEPDIAFLRVSVADGTEPLELRTTPLTDREPVAAIGYPAWDGRRNDADLMDDIFMGIYDVKRFSPGFAEPSDNDHVIIESDYSSLGGNSGSTVISLDSKKVVGLHFAGLFKDTNFAVSADIVAAAYRNLNTSIGSAGIPSAEETPTNEGQDLADREGYDPEFLGCGELAVAWPDFGNWADDRAPVEGNTIPELKYLHFSVVQSASRRLPMVTAVNIDGTKAFKLKRKGSWRLDGRLDRAHQIGNELYKHNPLDRGHLVRRMDPGWGDNREEAQQAEIDTFHYTNSAPQHKDLNQKDWVGLEDYILESADTKDFKLSAFTGPVFHDNDKKLKVQPGAEDIKIPEEYWKIAVMVNEDTGSLSATGYVLSQGKMIRDLTEAAFLLGEYKTYQVRIAMIEDVTGLNFGDLKNHDPLNTATESVFGQSALKIDGPGDLKL